MPAPEGNRNVEKGKSWSGALRAALAQYENKDAKIKKGEALRKVAEVVVLKAIAGDKDAIKEIGDRLDGKPAQALVGFDGGPITVEVVKFANTDTR